MLDGETSFAAELALLKSLGCPDTESAILFSVEVTGQTETLISAEASARMARWLEDELDAEPVGE